MGKVPLSGAMWARMRCGGGVGCDVEIVRLLTSGAMVGRVLTSRAAWVACCDVEIVSSSDEWCGVGPCRSVALCPVRQQRCPRFNLCSRCPDACPVCRSASVDAGLASIDADTAPMNGDTAPSAVSLPSARHPSCMLALRPFMHLDTARLSAALLPCVRALLTRYGCGVVATRSFSCAWY
eukprot:2571967-Rhodomonas_salina.1